jgi:hypothetical protein
MWVIPPAMDQSGLDQVGLGRPIPKDARLPTAEQEELQDEFDRRGEDPEAPGQHESREQIADET